MKRFFKLLVVALFLLVLVIPSGAATYFVDNTLVTGANDGSSWPNAFRSIADAEYYMDPSAYDTVFIKATATPYREYFGNNPWGNKTIYCDATGVDLIRGTAKAEFLGSFDTSGFTWIQEGASNVWRAEGVTVTSSVNSTSIVGWYYTAPTSITSIIGYGSTPPSPITNLPVNRFCYNNTLQYIWINIGADPNGKHIEIVKFNAVVEIWTGEKVYGFIAKHGVYGIHNSGCYNIICSGVESLYNRYGGQLTAGDFGTSTYLDNSSIHDNYLYGLWINGTWARNLYYRGNLIYNNRTGGIYFKSINDNLDPGEMGYIYNNTIYNNGGYGLYLTHDNQPSNWTVKNNIITGNITGQLYLYNSVNMNLTAGNNCPGTVNKYSGIWEANKGTGNVESDPLMIDPANADFRLRSASPCIGAGGNVGLTEIIPDIGAIPYSGRGGGFF